MGTGILHLFAVKAVAEDWSQGRLSSGICPSVPTRAAWRGGAFPAGKGAAAPLFSRNLKEPPGSWLCALGGLWASYKACSPLPSSWSPSKANSDSGPVWLHVVGGVSLKDAESSRVSASPPGAVQSSRVSEPSRVCGESGERLNGSQRRTPNGLG